MGIGKTLSTILNEKNVNPNELAERLGITPSTIYSIIKRDNTKVDITVLARICKELDVEMERFYQDYISEQKNNEEVLEFTYSEKQMIQMYRKLDDDGKEFVDIVIDHELKRCTKLQEQTLDESEKKLIEKYRSSDDNTKKIITSIPDMSEEIEVYRAAMSDDDHEDEIIKMSRAEIEELLSLPQTDEDL